MHDDEQDTPTVHEVDALDTDGQPARFEVIDVGNGEISVAIPPTTGTLALTSEQVDNLIDVLRRANGGE